MKFSLLILVVVSFHAIALGQDKARYKISSEYCNENKCLVRAFVESENYNEANMQMLAQELAEKYKDREIVDLRVFDDEKIIEAYIEGVREPMNVLSDSRAYFIHKAGCGAMLFYKSETDKTKLVKVSWKNKEICNKPFRVF